MMRNPIHIENDRLLIHPLKEQDLDSLRAMRSDKLLYRYEPTFLLERQGSPETALEVLRKMDLYVDRQCILGVYEKTDPSVLVGLAEFYDYKPSGKVISIGCRFLPAYWGKGIASSCVSAMLTYLRENTRVEMVTAHIIPGNKASERCAAKNGFEYLMTKTEDWGHDGGTVADVFTLDIQKNGSSPEY